MLHIGAGHSNNCQVKLKLFGYDRFCNNLQHKKFQANLVVSEVLIVINTCHTSKFALNFLCCKLLQNRSYPNKTSIISQ